MASAGCFVDQSKTSLIARNRLIILLIKKSFCNKFLPNFPIPNFKKFKKPKTKTKTKTKQNKTAKQRAEFS